MPCMTVDIDLVNNVNNFIHAYRITTQGPVALRKRRSRTPAPAFTSMAADGGPSETRSRPDD
jgi:hypothetical protein